jgi:hypothetical protein
MTEPTMVERELRDVALRLVRAGIPPDAVGNEMLAQRVSLIAQAHGTEHLLRLFEGLATAFRLSDPSTSGEPRGRKVRH